MGSRVRTRSNLRKNRSVEQKPKIVLEHLVGNILSATYFLKFCSFFHIHFPSVLWHCWSGNRKGIRPMKSWVLVCWWWWFDWGFARLTSSFVATTLIVLGTSRIQNETLRYWLYQFSWKVAVKRMSSSSSSYRRVQFRSSRGLLV